MKNLTVLGVPISRGLNHAKETALTNKTESFPQPFQTNSFSLKGSKGTMCTAPTGQQYCTCGSAGAPNGDTLDFQFDPQAASWPSLFQVSKMTGKLPFCTLPLAAGDTAWQSKQQPSQARLQKTVRPFCLKPVINSLSAPSNGESQDVR